MRLPSQRIARAKEAGLPKWRPAFTGSEPCATIGPDAYLMDDQHPRRADIEIMRDACNRCPMLQECFTWAIYRERHYFWAGTTSSQRKIIRTLHGIPLEEPSA